MKFVPILFVMYFSSQALAMLNCYTVGCNADGRKTNQAVFLGSAPHLTGLFLGKTVRQTFAYFGEETAQQIETAVDLAMASNDAVNPVSFILPDNQEEFEARFVRVVNPNGSVTVDIQVYPKD